MDQQFIEIWCPHPSHLDAADRPAAQSTAAAAAHAQGKSPHPRNTQEALTTAPTGVAAVPAYSLLQRRHQSHAHHPTSALPSEAVSEHSNHSAMHNFAPSTTELTPTGSFDAFGHESRHVTSFDTGFASLPSRFHGANTAGVGHVTSGGASHVSGEVEHSIPLSTSASPLGSTRRTTKPAASSSWQPADTPLASVHPLFDDSLPLYGGSGPLQSHHTAASSGLATRYHPLAAAAQAVHRSHQWHAWTSTAAVVPSGGNGGGTHGGAGTSLSGATVSTAPVTLNMDIGTRDASYEHLDHPSAATSDDQNIGLLTQIPKPGVLRIPGSPPRGAFTSTPNRASRRQTGSSGGGPRAPMTTRGPLLSPSVRGQEPSESSLPSEEPEQDVRAGSLP